MKIFLYIASVIASVVFAYIAGVLFSLGDWFDGLWILLDWWAVSVVFISLWKRRSLGKKPL